MASASSKFLDTIERVGNRLPDPATLFAIGIVVVAVVSAVSAWVGLEVDKVMLAGADRGVETVRAKSLLNADGIWWTVSNLVKNFINFPPLGIVLVGMFGIGLAERSGLISALIHRALARVPPALLTPSMVFIGIMSSLGLDAGYVVLPPLAAALYAALGRSPLAGIAAAFAGISAGFSANLSITALDPLLAGFTQAGAQFLDPDYRVAETANWWFMIASTFVLTATAWAVSAWWVEPRVANQPFVNILTEAPSEQDSPSEIRGLFWAGWAAVAVVTVVVAAILIPGAPLHGDGTRFPRWVEATVPLLFIVFFVPALAYGVAAGTIKSDRDVAIMLGKTMAGLGPYIVLGFFAAQFIAMFKYSHLGEILAVTGGNVLAGLSVPSAIVIPVFVGIVMLGNLFIGSASAKYAFFAPVFVPMFMQAGISPELTQVAFRVGDSITNVITPLNPYMIIVLAQVQRWVPTSGLGTVVALMLPYTLVFTIVWIPMLAWWILLGWPLGPGGSLTY